MRRSYLTFSIEVLFVIAVALGIRYLVRESEAGIVATNLRASSQHAAVDTENATTAPDIASSTLAATSSQAHGNSAEAVLSSKKKDQKKKVATVKKANIQAKKSVSSAHTEMASDNVERLDDPYTGAPLSLDEVNTRARAALVNIICLNTNGTVSPISGSGVFIDPKGVILTNAHVAQYILLSQTDGVSLQCFVRAGSPAKERWIPQVLYIPPVWVAAHASEITASHVLGTGEHDYALLAIAGSANGDTLPSSYPYLPIDTRERIGFQGDSVLVASYPAEFLGGITATQSLYAASSATTIQKLLTFATTSVDAIELGSVIEAQSGSSGGIVANPWAYEIGLITTTSEGATTADRTLRAISLSYIDRDIKLQSGVTLKEMLDGNIDKEVEHYTTDVAPDLIRQLLRAVYKR